MLRIILSSTNPGDFVLDAFAGTGTTLVVAEQLNRASIGIEIDKINIELIEKRIAEKRKADYVLFKDYECTPNLKAIWGTDEPDNKFISSYGHSDKQMTLNL